MRRAVPVTSYRPVRKAGERGSALLIVFVFAAMVAIMLYMEMPVAVFEAQRQKEQLLIDRGNEYAHAVKLFVRKIGTYPTSLDALEKTNNMRFLRKRFKDPFTGKDDWRILHAGPNGVLIDSKVKQTGLGQGANGTNLANTQGAFSGLSSNTGSSPFGSTSGTPGNSFGTTTNNSLGTFGSANANTDSTPPAVVVKPLPQRAPEMAANGSAQTANSAANQDPLAPLLPPGQAEASQSADTAALPANSGQSALPGQNATAATGGNPAPTIGTPATGSSMGTMGTIANGSIAGVASKAAGHSIKVVNDQSDYSLWEFYYDPTKDATRGVSNALGAMGAAQQANQQQNGIGTTSPFSNNSSGPFNNNSSGMTGSFGNGNVPTPTIPTPPSSTTPQQTPNQ